ncbi:uncharacterized protein LOC117118035 [Anneissia japonica]|uniref:uncharacterized protein LOC117118035 n=1 Tax=Anneissia japonica TaxID=1529436 RepID=UPI00142588DF|nr:uncharacterized protein LOC117118035 [Anneissia japonica]
MLKGNKKTNNINSVIISNTQTITSDKETIKSSLTEYFKTLGNKNIIPEDSTSVNSLLENDFNSCDSDDQNNTLNELDLTYEVVAAAIAHCKNNKSPGLDTITNEMLKNGGNGMIRSLYILFKRLSELKTIPNDWNVGVIFPIFKKGDPKDLSNYRGITLNSCVAKVTTALSPKQCHLEEFNVLSEVQGGFREDRRCEDHIFTLKSIISTRQSEGKKTFLAFSDFLKAFDTVWREGLFSAVSNIGVKGNLLQIIKNLYENVQVDENWFSTVLAKLMDISHVGFVKAASKYSKISGEATTSIPSTKVINPTSDDSNSNISKDIIVVSTDNPPIFTTKSQPVTDAESSGLHQGTNNLEQQLGNMAHQADCPEVTAIFSFGFLCNRNEGGFQQFCGYMTAGVDKVTKFIQARKVDVIECFKSFYR